MEKAYFVQNIETGRISQMLNLEQAVKELARIRILGLCEAVIVDEDMFVVPSSQWKPVAEKLFKIQE